MINATFRAENGLDPVWVVCESAEQMKIFRDCILSRRENVNHNFAYWDDDYPINAYAYIRDNWFDEDYGIDHLCLKNFPIAQEEESREYIGFLDWYNQISPVSEDEKLSDIGDLL